MGKTYAVKRLAGRQSASTLALVFVLASLLLLLGFCARSLAFDSSHVTAASDNNCDPVPGQLIVGFDRGVDDKQQRHALKQEGARNIDDLPAVDVEAQHEMDLVKVKGNLGQAVKKLEDNSDVKFAEPNCYVLADKTPNDPYLSDFQWDMNNTGQTVNGVAGTPDADIDAPQAWDLSIGSKQVVVAVVDTGIDYNHEDLANNMWTNLGEVPGNGKDDDGNGLVDDVRGWDFVNQDNDPLDGYSHGTHVAGTIGAVGNNGIGIAGVNWAVRLMPVKVLADDGRGSDASIAAGFAYAVASGATIVNASLGGNHFSQAQKDVIDAARDKTLFVVAAGNDHRDVDQTPAYPCSYDSQNIICVAATDQDDKLAVFSNYGTANVDIAAPGTNIYSTLPANRYGFKNGTSMATPHVAGAAALISAFETGITPQQLKGTILTAVYDDIPSLEGLVDGRRRLGLPNQGVPKKEPPTPKKPETPVPTVPPQPGIDRPDLPDPTAPDAPEPDLDFYVPVFGGGDGAVIIIGPYTELPSLGAIGGTIGNVNRSYVERVIASFKYQRGGSCWYMTDDPSVPWIDNSCSDELYFALDTDPSSGTFNLDLTPAQRAGLCAGKYTLIARVLTNDGQSIEVERKPMALAKGANLQRCGGKKRSRRKKLVHH